MVNQQLPVEDIYALIEREYGLSGSEIVEGEAIVAAAAAVRIWKQDPRRVAFTFVNLSANVLGIAPFGDLTTARQISVAANGGVVTVGFRDDLVLPSLEWFVLGTAAAEAFMTFGVRLTAKSQRSV